MENNKEQKRKEYLKAYYKANKDKIKEQSKTSKLNNLEQRKEYQKKYYEENKSKLIEQTKEYQKEYQKKYYEENKSKLIEQSKEYKKEYYKNKRLNEPLFKLKENIRTRIYNSIKLSGFKKSSRTEQILGCSFDDFIMYLESKFEPWMNWDNYGLYNGTENYGWDIDHKIPSSSATNEIEIIQLNHYTNLQPLCSYYNRVIKSDNC
jgi:hypothetical protein